MVAGHVHVLGSKEQTKHQAMLVLVEPGLCRGDGQSKRSGSGSNKRYEENKVGVEAAIIISRVVRKGHTEKVASEQRRRGEGSQPFRHWEESVPSGGEGRHQGPEAEGCLACRKVSATRGTWRRKWVQRNDWGSGWGRNTGGTWACTVEGWGV